MATNKQIETKTCSVCGAETTINPSALFFGEVQIVCSSAACGVHEIDPDGDRLLVTAADATRIAEMLKRIGTLVAAYSVPCGPRNWRDHLMGAHARQFNISSGKAKEDLYAALAIFDANKKYLKQQWEQEKRG